MELLVLLVMISPAYFFSDSADWVFENQLGYAYQVESPLTIKQDGESDIKLNAEWETKSFEMPPYWSMRTAAWNGGRAWEIELIHLKIFLKNRPSEIQRFNVSHGQNYLFLNRAFCFTGCFADGDFLSLAGLRWRVGFGATISHPEVTIR